MAFLASPHQYTDDSAELLRRSNLDRINWGLVGALAANTLIWTTLLAFAWGAFN